MSQPDFLRAPEGVSVLAGFPPAKCEVFLDRESCRLMFQERMDHRSWMKVLLPASEAAINAVRVNPKAANANVEVSTSGGDFLLELRCVSDGRNKAQFYLEHAEEVFCG